MIGKCHEGSQQPVSGLLLCVFSYTRSLRKRGYGFGAGSVLRVRICLWMFISSRTVLRYQDQEVSGQPKIGRVKPRSQCVIDRRHERWGMCQK